MKKILITGHSGFIGTNLVPILLSKNYKITGLSRTISKNDKIKEVKKDMQQVHPADVSRNSDIVHLAAITDFSYCQQNPVECFSANVMGTQNLLEIARKKDCKFIYVSTSHVYGMPDKLPISEEHPRNATSVYAASKIAGEVCCEAYSKTYGMDVSILRLFSVYGPHSPYHLVTTRIISQLFSKKMINLGNLYPKRDFIYITDVVKAIETVLSKSHGFSVYNVGSGRSYSISNICNIVKKLSGLHVPIKSSSTNLRKMDIPNVVSDITRIKKIGWKPTVSIEDGLRMTLEWYRNQNKN